MAIHESSVNYENLIRDLADMYPFDVAEVVLVELIANSLDAKPTTIHIDFEPVRKVLVVSDNGKGMTAQEFEQYHDFAAGLKTRGVGIGFAGVGAKISFNIATQVITETYSESFRGGSNWYLSAKKSLLWEDIQPTHLHSRGTRVEVRFRRDVKLPYNSTDDLITLLHSHYLPLLDEEFLDLYDALGCYSKELRFVVNGCLLEPSNLIQKFGLEKVRRFYPQKAGKRVGYGPFGIAQKEYPIRTGLCGVLLCTWGKVIKGDFFDQFPGNLGSRIVGIVEIPPLVNFLTTAKTDFVRREKHRDFESLYAPVRQEFKKWLMDIGVEPREIVSASETAKLERELKKILDEVPELGEFFGFRSRKPVLTLNKNGEIPVSIHEGADITFPVGEGEGAYGQCPADIGDSPGTAYIEDQANGTKTAKPISRVARRGPRIAMSNSPERQDLAWVEGNNIVINVGHPCYLKVQSDSAARRLHQLFAIAIAVQKFLASEGNAQNLTFVDKMMTAWGNK